LFLIKAVVVGQPKGFVLVHGEFDFLQRAPRHARRLEESTFRQ
jgi:hypothetical protein